MTIFIGLALLAGPIGAGSCYSRPSWIMNGEEYWKGVQSNAELPVRNKIKALRSGAITWNGERVSAKQLDQLLSTISQMEPQPLTQFEWEHGAPCSSIEEVRKLIRKAPKLRWDEEVP